MIIMFKLKNVDPFDGEQCLDLINRDIDFEFRYQPSGGGKHFAINSLGILYGDLSSARTFVKFIRSIRDAVLLNEPNSFSRFERGVQYEFTLEFLAGERYEYFFKVCSQGVIKQEILSRWNNGGFEPLFKRINDPSINRNQLDTSDIKEIFYDKIQYDKLLGTKCNESQLYLPFFCEQVTCTKEVLKWFNNLIFFEDKRSDKFDYDDEFGSHITSLLTKSCDLTPQIERVSEILSCKENNHVIILDCLDKDINSNKEEFIECILSEVEDWIDRDEIYGEGVRQAILAFNHNENLFLKQEAFYGFKKKIWIE